MIDTDGVAIVLVLDALAQRPPFKQLMLHMVRLATHPPDLDRLVKI